MKVMLVAFKPDGARVDFRVKGDRCVIGRDTDADLRIPVGTVSRQHCEVRVDGDEPVVRDLGSSNGTFLNGRRVTESVIDAGDLLRVGPTTFTVVIDGIPDVVTPPSEDATAGAADGSSMMESPAPAGRSAPAVRHDEDADDDDFDISAPPPAKGKAPKKAASAESDDDGVASDDPFAKMVERQDDDEDFDFDFFDDDEDEDDDDL